MLAFLLLGACGCAGAMEPPQSIYTAQVTSQTTAVDQTVPVVSLSSDDAASLAVPFTEKRAGGVIVIAPPTTAAGSEIARSPDGLFYVTAIVNGAAIRFLVDTGASMIVLKPDDARRAGVWAEEDAFRHTADTAGGKTTMARVVLDDVVVGGTRRRALNAAVVRSGLPVSLLGQNWVAQLTSLTISGNRMHFD